MHEYFNIRATLEDIRTIVILRNDIIGALLLLEWAKISLEFVPDSFSKQILEKEIKDLDKGLKSPFFIKIAPFVLVLDKKIICIKMKI